MIPPFFITALPRSGTTFLANFFTDAGVFCHHEALLGCHDMEDYAAKMRSREYYQMGDSDSGLPHYYKEVRERFPDGIWIGVRRDPTDVMQSLLRIGFWPGDEAFCALLDKHEAALQGCDRVVEFKDLFLTETLRNLWQNVTRLRFNRDRAEMLIRIRVEPDMSKYAPRYMEHLGIER